MKHKLFTFCDQAVVSGSNFLTILLCAKFLTLDNQASFIVSFSLYIGLLLFSISLIYSGLPIFYQKSNMRKNYFYSILVIHTLLTVSFLIVYEIIYLGITPYLDYKVNHETFLTFLCFLFFQQYADFARRASYVVFSSIEAFSFSAITYIPRIILLVFIEPRSLREVFVILMMTSLISVVFMVIKLLLFFKEEKLYMNFSLLKEHFVFSYSLIQSVPITWLSVYLPIWFAGIFSGSITVAVLGTFKNITNMANIFVEIIEVAYIVKWYEIFQKNGLNKLKQCIIIVVLKFTLFWLLGVGIIYVGYAYLIKILGSEYNGYVSVLLILWLSYLFYFYGRMYTLYYRILSNTKFEKEYATFSFFVALFSIIFIYYFDIYGASLSFLLISILPLIYYGIVKKK